MVTAPPVAGAGVQAVGERVDAGGMSVRRPLRRPPVARRVLRVVVALLAVPAVLGVPVTGWAAGTTAVSVYGDACHDAGGSPLDLRRIAVSEDDATDSYVLTIASCTAWDVADLGDQGSVDIPVAVPSGRTDAASHAVVVAPDGAGGLGLTVMSTPSDDAATWQVTAGSPVERPDRLTARAVFPRAALGAPAELFFLASSLDGQGREDLLPEQDTALRYPAPQGAGTASPTDMACPPARVPEDGFADADGSVHEENVDCVVWWQVSSGSGGGFAPAAPVTRAQMASFLARLIERSGGELPGSPPDAFADDAGSPHEASINRLAALGIVSGRSPGAYAPGEPVTRAQMATFLVRGYESRTADRLPALGDAFGDDDGNAHEERIDQAAAAGFTGGLAPGYYGPDAPVRRDSMATFLARVLDRLVTDERAALPG